MKIGKSTRESGNVRYQGGGGSTPLPIKKIEKTYSAGPEYNFLLKTFFCNVNLCFVVRTCIFEIQVSGRSAKTRFFFKSKLSISISEHWFRLVYV